MWQEQLESLIHHLDDSERKLLAESASKLGRRWLNTIPFYQTLSLSDFEVSTALHYRLLAPSPLSICAWCSKSNSLGHDELCMARHRLTVARHDSVARIIHSALKTVNPTAELEPHTSEGRRRNDIRLRGPQIGPIDFDIKVYTLLAAHATKTTTAPPQGTSLTSHITQQSVKYRDRITGMSHSIGPSQVVALLPLSSLQAASWPRAQETKFEAGKANSSPLQATHQDMYIKLP